MHVYIRTALPSVSVPKYHLSKEDQFDKFSYHAQFTGYYDCPLCEDENKCCDIFHSSDAESLIDVFRM